MNDPAFAYGVILGALFVGLLCGLIPLLVGLKKGENVYAWGGFAACTVCGLLRGLMLAVPAAIIFLVIILITSNKSSSQR